MENKKKRKITFLVIGLSLLIFITGLISGISVNATEDILLQDMPTGFEGKSYFAYHSSYGAGEDRVIFIYENKEMVGFIENGKYMIRARDNSPFTYKIKIRDYNTNGIWESALGGTDSVTVHKLQSVHPYYTLYNTNCNWYTDNTLSTIFFQRAFTSGNLTQTAEEALTSLSPLRQVISLLPLAIGLIVSFLALRKALKMLYNLFHKA